MQLRAGKWPFFMLGLLAFTGVVLKLFLSLMARAEKLGPTGMLFAFECFPISLYPMATDCNCPSPLKRSILRSNSVGGGEAEQLFKFVANRTAARLQWLL